MSTLSEIEGWRSLSLDELAAKLAGLSQKDRDAIAAAAGAATASRKFIPNVGPQMAAFFSPADICFYGGAAGGGKSSLICGLSLTEHERSLIMRQQFNDLDALTEELIRLYGSRKGFNGSNPPSLRTEDGRFIQFSGATKDQWQGHPFDLKCVGAETLVRMASSPDKPITDIRVGDVVETLEGHRVVTRVLPRRFDDSVFVQAHSSDGTLLGSQYQGVSHELLCSREWASYEGLQTGGCFPRRNYVGHKPGLLSLGWYQLVSQCHKLSCSGRRPFLELFSGLMGCLFGSGSYASYDLSGEATWSGSSYGGLLTRVPRLLLTPFSLGLPLLSPLGFLRPYMSSSNFESAGCGAATSSEPQCCPDDCLSCNRPCGVRARQNSGSSLVVEGGLFCPRQQAGVERPIPNGFEGGAQGRTPRRSLQIRTFVHPYTMEKRQAVLGTETCAFSMTPSGKRWLYDLEVDDANHYVTGAGFVNRNCFDECTQVDEDVIRYHIGWLRSVREGQRKRVLLCSNPPIDERGQYLLGMFRPWLDPAHPNPAKDGELRWYITTPDDEDLEVEGPEPIQFSGEDRPLQPMSRTFIRAKLADNPYLANSGYQKSLDQMREPYRSAMRDGNFFAVRRDKPDQVIPMEWIRAAQARWTPRPPAGLRMTAIGFDVGQGGMDRVAAAPRYGFWYDQLKVAQGKDAPDGPTQAAFVERHRRDGAPIVVDVGGGFGGDVCSVFKSNSTPYLRFNGVEEGVGKANDGSGRGFENRRAQAWWRFREALNPDQPGGSEVCLPPDPELAAELSVPMLIPDKRDIQIESKKDIRKRLGKSPDKADAVVMAWEPGDKAQKRKQASNRGGGQPARANVGYAGIKNVGAGR